MKFFNNIKIQKLNAAFFLALLVFIHVVKAFHTHDYAIVNAYDTSKKESVLKQIYSCAICDYQVTKDSDSYIDELRIERPVWIIISYFHYIAPQVFSSHVFVSSRGPPAFV